jgi:uncharacterized protein
MSKHSDAQMHITVPETISDAEQLFCLGMRYSTGQAGGLDMVAAHKYFNIAGLLGSKEAVRLRNEVALEMSATEIATAQRAARDWITGH